MTLRPRYVIVILRFVHMYEEIIHSQKLVDYLPVQADKPWYNYYIPSSSVKNLLSVKYFVLKFVDVCIAQEGWEGRRQGLGKGVGQTLAC